MKHKRNLMQIFLIPLIIMCLIQAVFPFSVLHLSGIKSELENSEVSMDHHIIENRQVVLENEMIQEWGHIYYESDDLELALTQVLDQYGTDMDTFLQSGEMQQAFLTSVFPAMLTTLQNNSSSGIYVILANDSPLTGAAAYHGFFIRDSDSRTKTANNSDLLLERGDKQLARSASLSLDSSWSTDFRLAGNGVRSADDFFYEPYLAAMANPETDMINLGYWSMPFILEDHYMDNHSMITYSVPLIHDGVVYGVVGVEVSENDLADYFPVSDLDSDLNAGYALILEKGGGEYELITGKGTLFHTIRQAGSQFRMEQQSIRGLYRVEGVRSGKQRIYAMLSELNLYSNNVPYENTRWALCGFVTENSVFGVGDSVYSGFLLMVGICTLISLAIAILMTRKITSPVYRLMESIRGGIAGLHSFRPSGILEVDELHQVIETMTDAQNEAEELLEEEKERYRVAIESSKDIFFTYHMEEKILEVVNSRTFDGIWDCKLHPEYLKIQEVFPADRQKLQEALKNLKETVSLEFRLYSESAAKYVWYNLYVSLVEGSDGQRPRMVGCLHDINEQKILELARKKDKLTDSITSFYTLDAGLEAVQMACRRDNDGVLALLDLKDFTAITKQYGVTFGDVLLEQLSVILTMQRRPKGMTAVFVRAGDDEILGWFPETDVPHVLDMLQRVRTAYMELVHHEALQLDFNCGLTGSTGKASVETLIGQVKQALCAAKRRNLFAVTYQDMSDKEKQRGVTEEFGEILSAGYMKQMSLVSLTLNLFDRGGAASVIMDLLVKKFQEYYRFDDLLITRYSRENMVNLLEYEWNPGKEKRPQVIRCSEADYAAFLEEKGEQNIQVADKKLSGSRMFAELLRGEGGIAIHITDNGQYSGSILFVGMSAALRENPEDWKTLGEIGSIIQTRINQEKHDLSARAKSDFLARMSHEIRTPMNGIMGMTEIALEDGQTEERRMDCLQKIRSSSKYLLGLINDILDMSKIESGKMHLVETECNLQNLLPELKVLVASKILENDLHYKEEISLQHAWFLGDEIRIRQVLVNLLGNAIKYTNPGGYVRLKVMETPLDDRYSDIYFEVADNGIGIDPENQERIFQSFEQVKNEDTIRKEGTGLGLAICNRLVHLMASTIQLKSIPGEGSVFSFTLKLRRCDAKKTDSGSEKEQLTLEGKKILVVEDNDLNREIICTILEEQGILVDAVEDGQEAVERMEESKPGAYDMILMDIMMPVMNGLEATREIRRSDREDLRTIPIVAMSANAFEEDVKTSLESGMNGHLSKPLDIRKLKETLERYLS